MQYISKLTFATLLGINILICLIIMIYFHKTWLKSNYFKLPKGTHNFKII